MLQCGSLITAVDDRAVVHILKQPQPTGQVAVPAAAQSAAAFEEVAVTAQKRPENIQTIPYRSWLSAPRPCGIWELTEGFDLANQVPHMNADSPDADSTVRYFLRGVGAQDFNTLASSLIALYVDDVYLGAPSPIP